MSGKVLFVSQNPLGRCENLTAVWDAYRGAKEFRHGMGAMASAEMDGYAAVVCDALPVYMEGKSRCKIINVCHGMTGNKFYGYDESYKPWFDRRAAMQTDVATAASEQIAGIVAQQLCIPVERVAATGFPRTDMYFDEELAARYRPGDGVRRYLYAPTFRNNDGKLPDIDWGKVDSILGDDEVLMVKRHYFTREPLAGGGFDHVWEVSPGDESASYIFRCDVLATDYSSIMFDAYLLGKPVVLVEDDKEEYLDKRGMYFDYPSFYSSRHVCAEGNEEAFVAMLREAAENGMGAIERACVEKVAGACDGHSTERVVKLIKEMAEDGEHR